VFNVLCDQNELGPLLTGHPDIAKIAFTGSTATGKKVMAAAADSVKRVTLELGGNDAAIVLDDVNPQAVARKVYQGAMANAGQICVAIKRAYVPSSMYDEFCDELAKLANEAVVDDGSKQGATIGPVQNRMQFERSCRCWTAPVPRAPCLPAARRWTGRAISSLPRSSAISATMPRWCARNSSARCCRCCNTMISKT
jgi:acyl-CoA reductase-like NAD-dependent aldehyde dehydrogenase